MTKVTDTTQELIYTNPRLYQALRYAKSGHHLVPLDLYPASGKKPGYINPHMRALPVDEAGGAVWSPLRDTAATPLQIVKWFMLDPTCNIGVIPGCKGYVVADVDRPEHYPSSWKDYRTPTVLRGEERYHLWFRIPDDMDLTFTKKDFEWGELICRGYMVMPPSLHVESGENYKWAEGRSLFEIPAEPLPHHISSSSLSIYLKNKSTISISLDHTKKPIVLRNPVFF